ncbi:hypothetical protein L3X38_023271 [Prunus dulcis]|uniref:Uncharacterized protein n=1 Tax=Prunus dulcis TaxID=3755 RepID=A0AAD4Z559_PRUDU|nr:hypothetical protein L3X38_023271 [Prunus dulcis]
MQCGRDDDDVVVEVEVGGLVPVLEASGYGGYGSGVGEEGASEVGLDGGYESVFIDIGKRDRGRERERGGDGRRREGMVVR